MTKQANLQRFLGARFGLFVHFGLYSLLGRGEWVLNRESLPAEAYRSLADRFEVPAFDADALVQMAKHAGARYLIFTTMHHDGFALYDSAVNPFNSVRHGCRRDLVAEVVDACRKHSIGVHLYHTLNSWLTPEGIPDSVAALESETDHKTFVDYTHARIEELLRMFNPIDCLWYDGWWPFDAKGWRSVEMDAMVHAIQPHILVNNRNGLTGDFGTPEQHLAVPHPWRPWEANLTHNRNWGFHHGDHAFKSPADVIDMLTQCATGGGNFVINVGPDGEGRIPEPSIQMLETVGDWLSRHGDAIYGSEPLLMNLRERREGDRGDWMHHGRFTAKGNTLYAHLLQWPGSTLHLAGIEGRARQAQLLDPHAPLQFKQDGGHLTIEGLPLHPPHTLGGVVAIEFDGPWSLYLTGGLRVPSVPHPRYDPVPSDLPG